GHGRGRRMQIEQDLVEITSGVRHGYTLGSPIALVVNNDDFKHWEDIMGEDPIDEDAKIRRIVSRPRPGHADLNGAMKYGHREDRKSTRLNSSHVSISYAVFCLKRRMNMEMK